MHYLLRIIFILIIAISQSILFAQKEANNWYFGYGAGVTFSTGNAKGIANGSLYTGEGCTSISNKNGELLFYTDGVYVYDSTHLMMKNGSNLNGNFSTTQSAVIIPKPGSNNIYYIFTSDCADNVFSKNGLQYSEVDMNLNGGKGDVTNNKNIQLLGYTSERMCATRHGNDTDYWICTTKNNDTLYSFKISANGIDKIPVKSVFNRNISNASGIYGYMKISNSGSFLGAAYNDSIYLCRFDNIKGKITDTKGLDIVAYGFEFSASDKLLYASARKNPLGVYQYNLQSNIPSVILSSKIKIGNVNTSYSGALQIGPDTRIYCTTLDSLYLDVIKFPDSIGLRSVYVQKAVQLGGKISKLGLPNFVQSFFYHKFNYTRTCINDTTYFTLTSLNLDSVKWDFGDPSSGIKNTSTKSINIYHQYKNSGNYKVKLISYHPKKIIDTTLRYIRVTDSKPYLGKDTAFCSSNINLILAPKKEYLSYKWGITKIISKEFPVNNSGTYRLQVLDTNGCTSADTIVVSIKSVKANFNLSDSQVCSETKLSLQDGSIYKNDKRHTVFWYYGDGSFSTDTMVEKTFTTEGKYQIKLVVKNQNNCIDSVVKAITVLPKIHADFSINDSTQCFNLNKFDFTNTTNIGSIGTYSYLWQMGDSTFSNQLNISSKYYLKDSTYSIKLIVDINGRCRDTMTKMVLVYPSPQVSFMNSKPVQCFKNNTSNFTNYSNVKNDTLIYNWSFDDNTFSFAKDIYNKRYLKSDSFLVTLYAISSHGCKDSAMEKIFIYPPVSASFKVNRDTQCLKNNLFIFTPLDTLSMASHWLFGNGDSLNSNNQSNISHHNNFKGNYTVTNIASNSSNCKDTFVKFITVKESPKAAFIIKDSLPCLDGNSLNLTMNSVCDNPTQLNQVVNWGDGIQSNIIGNRDIKHVYVKDSSYKLTLISNLGNCSDTIDKSITVAFRQNLNLSVTGFCLGDTTIGKVTNSVFNASNTYNWWVNSSLQSNKDSSIKITWPAVGSYQIKVATAIGLCKGSDSSTINVIVKPKANFTYLKLPATQLGFPFRFIDQSQQNTTWTWFTKNNRFSTIQNPDYTFNDTGYYKIKLVVSN
ncbi:MAG: PKD domain-containing protein, partial [bacterium]|nr:PKD domain-containing protein [bacterium]